VTLVEDQCRAGDNTVCANQMTFNDTVYPGGLTGAAAWQAGNYNATSVRATSFNGAFYEVKGVDFSLNYLFDMGKAGSLNTRLLTTFMDQQVFQNCTATFPGAPCYTYNILGQTGTGNNFLNDYTPTAKWRGSLIVTWSNGPLSITPSMNFVGRGI